MTLPPETPDLAVLDLLVSVADTGSLGAAARRHSMSQPAASMRISALERRLRLRLLDRGPTGSTLTHSGCAVVASARAVLDTAQIFNRTVAALHSADTPRLRIAASKTIADHKIPEWLTQLRAIRPDITVSLEVDNTAHVEAMVRTGDADLGFVEGPHPPPDLGGRILGTDELLVVVGASHPWASRTTPVTLGELAATPLLWRESGSGTRDTVREILGTEGPPAPPAAELGSSVAIVSAARAGMAPAVLSTLVTAAEIASGALRRVRLDDSIVLNRQFRVIWRRNAPPSGPAELLLQCALRS